MYFCGKKTVGGVKWLLDGRLVLGQTGFKLYHLVFGSCMVTFDTDNL